ncbi:hypothetical protein F9B74_04325 [Pelistega sp. NLN82]|uniref:Uncharacterized protein n=1 Tax=Pelistega ratti TaxID=2652177 RepID=A0A6L9Y6V2_9BURK|nr:hypothetical protein [Pelistega ratti]NEN75554.1 hypothetical protein [Pelistega ratti]
MRTLRFSAATTVFLFIVLPAILSVLVMVVLSIYYVIAKGGLTHLEWYISILVLLHGFGMYAVPFLILGVMTVFLLDKGLSATGILLLSIISAVILVVWRIIIEDDIVPIIMVLALGFMSVYGLLMWVSVPIEQRKVPKLFSYDEHK